MPIPFTEEAVHHVAARIRQTQDILGRRIAVENVSYYAAPPMRPGAERDRLHQRRARPRPTATCCSTSTTSTSTRSTTATTPREFLAALPSERIAYIHVAGHYDEADDLKVDTHGAPVKDAVWALLGDAYRRLGVRPTLLERDFNFPPYAELVDELDTIRRRDATHARSPPAAPADAHHALRHPRACARSSSR